MHLSKFMVGTILPCLVRCTSYLPPPVTGMTIIDSKFDKGASLSFKETKICETTPGVKSFSGYIHLPASVTKGFTKNQNVGTNTYFWFFEARNNPENAPLSIFLGGGPGESSIYELTLENGPCYVNDDANSTRVNPHSFNEHVNMLYIDQPSMVGFSYSSLMNGTLDMLGTPIPSEADFSDGVPEPSDSMFVGTFPNQDAGLVPNTTMNCAKGMWHFMQNWAATFPHYRQGTKLSIWADSYGGFYAPGTFSHFLDQNRKIESGHLPKAEKFDLDTMGLLNGCIDIGIIAPYFPQMAFNNTYNFQAYNETVFEAVNKAVNKPKGCLDLVRQCRSLADEYDPHWTGGNKKVDQACGAAMEMCFSKVLTPYMTVSGRSSFDLAHPLQDPLPKGTSMGYFNRGWVQQALGVPVNYTWDSSSVERVHLQLTGDVVRQDIRHLNKILSAGKNVALIYGDRDYKCNWLGHERVALEADYPNTGAFNKAGYAALRPDSANLAHTTGFVRQHAGFSFSRVFQAGHSVAWYQPATVQAIFNRAMFGRDVATGKEAVSQDLSTEGPHSVFDITNDLPEEPPINCYQWSAPISCTAKQLKALKKGTAVIKDFFIQSPKP